MRPNIDFKECLKDSPRFRGSLEEAETEIDQLELKLEKMVKLCTNMIEAGKTFNNANSAFINGVKDVAEQFKEDEEISAVLERFIHNMTELQKYHTILFDQAHRSICKNVNNFIKNEIKKVKDTRKHFEKISDDMDNALIKNAQSLRSKPQECEDAHNVLTAMRSCFAHMSLDYVFQINILHSRKRFDVLDTMLAYMHAQNAFFHQGYDLFTDLEPYMKQVATQIEDLSDKAAVERKGMEERHSLVQQHKELAPSEDDDFTSNNEHDIKMEGYLFKRTSNAFKSWVRRWFMIKNNQLVYRKRSRDNVTIMEDDLRLCSVKPVMEIDRRFCFEVISPSRSHMLQADSEVECQAWINAINAGVTKAYTRGSASDGHMEDTESASSAEGSADNNTQADARPTSRMELLLSIPGNEFCCDCKSPEPRWASINLGITLCIECSGIHRSFGVHMSKVRSVTLDAWEPELMKVMAELGNDAVNRIYEADIDESVAKRATPQCSRDMREAWIRAKYVQKAFVRKLPQEEPNPSPSKSTELKAKRWSVYKRKRRSPARKMAPDSSPESDKPKMVQGESQDSGLGGSTADVIVFGAGVSNGADTSRNIDLEDSEESMSETEADQDAKSTTSFEDFSKLHPDMLLYKAAQARNLAVIVEALALGANPNWQNEDEDSKTPLMKAVESGSMAPCELLLLNGSKVDRRDGRGRSALHHATILGNTGQVCQLLKRHANQHAVDENGKDPLAIAIDAANADIVTLLRLAKLNEEMKESDGIHMGQSDETFNDVFRDFTNMASHAPEKLNRKKQPE